MPANVLQLHHGILVPKAETKGTYLAVVEVEFTEISGHGIRRLNTVEHHVNEHGGEDEGEGAQHALQTREVVVRVKREHTEPQMSVSQALKELCEQEIVTKHLQLALPPYFFCLSFSVPPLSLFLAGNGQNTTMCRGAPKSLFRRKNVTYQDSSSFKLGFPLEIFLSHNLSRILRNKRGADLFQLQVGIKPGVVLKRPHFLHLQISNNYFPQKPSRSNNTIASSAQVLAVSHRLAETGRFGWNQKHMDMIAQKIGRCFFLAVL